MANVLDFLGAQKQYFQKAGWEIHCNTGSSMQYVGKTEGEVEIDMGVENAEFLDNTTGVQTLYVLTQTKIDPKVNFQFKQTLEPNVHALVFNLDLDTSDAIWDYNFIGSNPNDYSYYPWLLVSQGLTGLQAEIYIRSGVCFSNGAWTSGAGGALAALPATIRMCQDTTIANTKRDLGYIRVQKPTLS